ncbi:MAG: hypothetical protein IKU06_11085 [Lachnospiraceae bacterium]|nr:hypothetical protein [Lachnospiraceae bacterium]
MIKALFEAVLDISVIAGIFILIVAVLRVLFNRSPKWTRYFLWFLVALRLMCPIFIESEWSFIPKKALYISKAFEMVQHSVEGKENISQETDILGVLSVIWLIGIALLLVRLIVENVIIYRKTQSAVSADRLKKEYGSYDWMKNNNIFFLDRIGTSFTKGLFKPVIYIPTNSCPDDIASIIAHEQVHIKRKDLLWKQLGYLIATVYWFNPIVWLGYILFINDIEFACDEKIVRNMNDEDRKKYLLALIRSNENSNKYEFSTVAFGKMPIRRRLKEIMKIKKISICAAVIAVLAGIGVSIFFFTRPSGEEKAHANEIVEKITEKGEKILPKGTDMTPENAIIVPEEEWKETGLTDPSIYEALPDGMREIEKIYKWNIETDDGYVTNYGIVQ